VRNTPKDGDAFAAGGGKGISYGEAAADDIIPEPVFAAAAAETRSASGETVTDAASGGYGSSGDYGGSYGGGGYGGYGGGTNDTTDSSSDSPSIAPPNNTTPYNFDVRFVGMVYDALIADAGKLAEFKLAVRSAVALAIKLDISYIAIASLRSGSVVRARVLFVCVCGGGRLVEE
jgi:hypothetical protein